MKKLTIEEAGTIYNIMFPGEGKLPSRPDILYSLTGEWKGWCDSLGNQNEKQKDEDFNKAWDVIFK